MFTENLISNTSHKNSSNTSSYVTNLAGCCYNSLHPETSSHEDYLPANVSSILCSYIPKKQAVVIIK